MEGREGGKKNATRLTHAEEAPRAAVPVPQVEEGTPRGVVLGVVAVVAEEARPLGRRVVVVVLAASLVGVRARVRLVALVVLMRGGFVRFVRLARDDGGAVPAVEETHRRYCCVYPVRCYNCAAARCLSDMAIVVNVTGWFFLE